MRDDDDRIEPKTNEELLCIAKGHDWINYMTDVPGRAGPFMSTVCQCCKVRGVFPQNVRPVGPA